MMLAPTAAPPRRKINATTIMAALLALVALGASGLFVQERMRFDDYWEQDRDKAEAAKATLDSIKFDARGNVPPDQRSKFDEAMMNMKLSTDGMRMFNESRARTVPYIGGAIAAFLVFSVIAFRSTKQTA
jgi:hypothetical protein